MENNIRFRDQFTIGSKLKFLAWILLTAPSRVKPLRKLSYSLHCEVSLTMRNGDRLFLRNRDDYGVAYEVFMKKLYEVACSGARLIFDLGGHAGFTMLYFARLCSDARIVVIEPDHRRANQIRKHIRSNRLEGRVDLIEAAASCRSGKSRLSACGSASHLGAEGEEVTVVDVFGMLSSERIDILKMDIEGSEYEILGDPRFEKFAPTVIAMEWHCTPEHRDGRQWCLQRLHALGYQIIKEFRDIAWAGNLVAVRRPS